MVSFDAAAVLEAITACCDPISLTDAADSASLLLSVTEVVALEGPDADNGGTRPTGSRGRHSTVLMSSQDQGRGATAPRTVFSPVTE